MSHFLSHDGAFTVSNDLALYYMYSVKYFVENHLQDEKYKKRFNLGLYWTNKFNNNRFKILVFNDCGAINIISLFRVVCGGIFCIFRQVWIWKFL